MANDDYTTTCNLTATFNSARDFYLFVDIHTEGVSVPYTVHYNFVSSGGNTGSISPPQLADGAWTGTASHSNGGSNNVIAFSSGGKFMMYSVDDYNPVLFSGNVIVNGNEFTSSLINQYEENGSYIMSYQVDGDIYPKSSIYADVIYGGDASVLNLQYYNDIDQPLSYTDLSGSWYFQNVDGATIPVNVDANGNFSANDNGCIISGKLTIPNTEQSIITSQFSVVGSASYCMVGDFNGLGMYDSDWGEISIMAASAQYGITQYFWR
jgi:hypothetical protein